VAILVWDVDRQNLRRGFPLCAQGGREIELSLLGRHDPIESLLGLKVKRII